MADTDTFPKRRTRNPQPVAGGNPSPDAGTKPARSSYSNVTGRRRDESADSPDVPTTSYPSKRRTRATPGLTVKDRTNPAGQPDMREIGLPGSKILAGLVFEEDNPDLQGQAGLQMWKEMGFDPQVRAMYLSQTLPIRGSRWFMEPASDDPEAVKMADFMHHVLWEFGSQSFDDVLRQGLEDKQYGFSMSEVVYDHVVDGEFSGMVGWDKLAYRSQVSKWRWNIEEVDTPGGGRIRELVSVTQLAPPSYVTTEIPREKLALWVNEQQGENYDGWSLLRYAYKPWFYKDLLTRIEAIGLERAYMGIPYVKLPADYSDAELSAAAKVVENLRTHESAGVVLSEAMPLEVLMNKLEGSPMRAAVDWWDTQILQSALVGWLKLGQNRGGAYSLATEFDYLTLLMLNSSANRFAQVLNLWPCIPLLLSYNFRNIDPSKLPKLAHGDIGQRNLDKLGRVLQALGQWGFVTPDPETEDAFRRYMDLPERDDTVTPDALRDLVEEVMPKEPEYGKAYGPTVPPPAVQVANVQNQGKLAVAQKTSAATAAARTKPQGSNAPATGGHAQAGYFDGAERAYAIAQYREAQHRAPWHKLEHTPENRPRAQAMWRLAEEFEGWVADVKGAARPEKPSIIMAKRRKPYVVMGAEDFARASGRATVETVLRAARSGNLAPVRHDGKAVQADAPDAELAHDPRPAPHYAALSSRHEAAVRAFFEAPSKAAA